MPIAICTHLLNLAEHQIVRVKIDQNVYCFHVCSFDGTLRHETTDCRFTGLVATKILCVCFFFYLIMLDVYVCFPFKYIGFNELAMELVFAAICRDRSYILPTIIHAIFNSV